jgi:hypothetical protein
MDNESNSNTPETDDDLLLVGWKRGAAARKEQCRNLARERDESLAQLSEAWHLLSVLSANMLDDGPSWPRVLEWLARNEEHRP